METLSDKIIRNSHIKKEDVKEFLFELKEDIENAQENNGNLDWINKEQAIKIIKKRAGEKLTWNADTQE